MKKNLNFCFFGSSTYSIWVLKTISKKYKPGLLITLPAKPAGRGMKLQPNPVFIFGLKEKLPVIEWKENLDFLDDIKSFEFGLLAGFGKIIPIELIKIFKLGILNLHPSLLPRYRGANPIREAILNGDNKTGVTLFLIDEKIDHGPIIGQIEYMLKGNETLNELEEKLGILGGKLFNDVIEKYLANEIDLIPQDEEKATYTRKISKEDGFLKIEDGYEIWERKIRALNPWPGTFIKINLNKEGGQEKILKIFNIEKVYEKELPEKIRKIKLGEFFQWRNELGIKLSDSFVIIHELQLQDRKKMSSKEFLNGYPLGSFHISQC